MSALITRPRVCIALPSYGPQDPLVGDALADLQVLLTESKVPYRRERLQQCPYFAHAMNALIASFLTITPAEGFRDRLLFLDNDVLFRAKDALRLIESTAECVGAHVALKDGSGQSSTVPTGLGLITREKLLSVSRMCSGLMCLSRPLLLRMAEQAEHYTWAGIDVPRLFSDEVIDGKFVGADEMFFRRVEEADGLVLVDPTIGSGHVGPCIYEVRREPEPEKAA